jgi:arylsulfatase A-like enzyme
MLRSFSRRRLGVLVCALTLAARGHDARVATMTCEVLPAGRGAAYDPAQLPRYAVSPLLRTAATARDAAIDWTAGTGFTVRPQGDAPAVTLPAPVPFGKRGDTRLVLDVSTARALELTVAWSDDACETPGPPCVAQVAVPWAGRHVLPVDLSAHTGAPRTLEIRLPADAGPVTLHALRAGLFEPERHPGTSARDVPVTAPDLAPTVTEANAATPRFEPGAGLRLVPAPGAADPLDVWVAMRLDQPAMEARFLVVTVDAPRETRLRAYFTASACPKFAEACAIGLVQVTPGTYVSDMVANPWWRGRVDSLRLDLDMPAPEPAPATIRSVRFVSRAAWRDVLAAQTLPFVLVGPDRASPVRAAEKVEAQHVPGAGLDVQLAPRTGGEPYVPSVLLQVDADAELASLVVLEHIGLESDELSLYFSGTGCPGLSEECHATLSRAWGGRYTADLSRTPRWAGTIDSIRIDFPPEPGEHFLVRSLRFEPPLAPSAFRDDGNTGSLRRGARALSRLEGGPLGWDVPAGHALECGWAGTPPRPGAAPHALRVRVPAVPNVIDFAAVRAEWVHADGQTETAATYDDAYGTPRAAEWISVPLRAPATTPAGLRVEVTCADHCDASGWSGRVVQVARPSYHTVPAAGDARHGPQHLLLVSLDTLRADRVPGYGAAPGGLPFLAAFARDATVYERVYAVDTWTIPTHAALLTGRYPTAFGHQIFEGVHDDVPTLAGRLAGDGWATIAETDGILMSPVHELDRGFERYGARYEPFARKREAFVEEVAEATAAGVPVFAFLHTYAAHSPYSAPRGPALDWLLSAGAGTMAVPFKDPAKLLAQPAFLAHQAEAVRHLEARYDAALRAIDPELAALFADPRLAQFLADAVVAVTSDHGEEMLEHAGLGHGAQLPYPELTHVPLLVRVPGRPGGRDTRLRSQTEVPGLLLAALGRPDDLPVAGACAEHGLPLAVVTGPGPAEYPLTSYVSVGVFADGGELIRVVDRETRAVAHEEVVPLPGTDSHPAEPPLDEMRKAAACLEADRLGAPPPLGRDATVPDVDRERLRALGYVAD